MLYHDILRVSFYPENLQKTDIKVLLFPLLEALKHFTKDELTDAKVILWAVVNKTVLWKMIKHQGTSKSNAEINDISNALKT